MNPLNFLRKLLWLPLAALLVGCDDDGPDPGVIWDFAPGMVEIYVTDPSGRENLLDPDAEHTIANNPIALIYKDKRFEIDRETLVFGPETSGLYAASSRAVPVTFYGLCLAYSYRMNWHLVVGEFSGDNDYEKEPFVIDWGDGTTTRIEFDFYRTWRDRQPTTHRNIYVDGEFRAMRLDCVIEREI